MPVVAQPEIEIDAADRADVSVTGVTSLSRVRIVAAGNAGSDFEVDLSTGHVDVLEFEACFAARILIKTRLRVGKLSICGPASAMPIELHALDGLECRELNIENATVHLERPALGMSVLRLVDAGISIDRPVRIDQLELSGQVSFQTRGLQADQTSLVGTEACLQSRYGTVDLGAVDGGCANLQLAGGTSNPFALRRLPRKMRVTLQDSCVELIGGCMVDCGAVADAVFAGNGDIRVSIPTLRPRFEPSPAGELRVALQPQGSIAEASGEVNLVEAHGGSISGQRSATPLTLVGVGEIDGVDIEHVDLFGLPDLQSLQRLACARRVVPWMPRPWRVRQRQEVQFTAGFANAHDRWSRTARFWSDVAEILHRSEASGGIQSDIRVAVLRARRRSLTARDHTREWLLLSLYALLGYGERVTAPLVVWFMSCLLGASALKLVPAATTPEAYPRVLVRLMAAPLALAHVDVSFPDQVGMLDNAVYGGCKVAGVLLVSLAIVAGRRTVRPKLSR